ncbi:lymphocyte antigen 75-like [Labrus bergylta]|uniref:lymphocyte antigen 75-like n=1 Tax=Labrus bergylta TaxID=56723 RepID=UPI003313876E
MRNKSCPQLTLCFLLMATECLEASTLQKSFTLIRPGTTWTEARLYCRQNKIDLIPLNIAKKQLSTWSVERPVKKVWIGAHRDPEVPSAWKSISLRSGGDETIWAPSHPGDEDCALLNNDTGQIDGRACSKSLPFVCFGDNLVLVKENKTWEDALQHCHDMGSQCDSGGPCRFTFRLLTLKKLADYNYVRDRIYNADTDEVWTGLRFLAGGWFWLDGEKMEDEEKLPRCPSEWKHCGTVSKFDSNNWITRDCSEKRNFICVRSKIPE